jgi:hypothetical protein
VLGKCAEQKENRNMATKMQKKETKTKIVTKYFNVRQL